MSSLWSEVVRKLTPYVPGEQPSDPNIIKMNTNENPYGPSPKVIEALIKEADSKLRLYPDPDCSGVKIAVAEYYGGSRIFHFNYSIHFCAE